MNAVRSEIQTTHTTVNGRWDMTTLARLDKLESVMETARLAPGTLLVYSRVIQRDCIVRGIELKKSQFITVSGMARASDPTIFEDPKSFRGLRFCEESKQDEHRAKPFRSVDIDILTWRAGRWACPGRQVADMAIKGCARKSAQFVRF
ncbi:Cytochrome P450 [Metarhizium guizhouense ARSEF 977]|uniref:Cytochrome P450 n=1 Tax=Metarhizium guizhouense (strain ARSEF 977) TaxID=1276136 RepID=A0A0B4GYW1_METGA|nr:Cytochrome P450 [Metarhizium guizhouense ARSEF 977]